MRIGRGSLKIVLWSVGGLADIWLSGNALLNVRLGGKLLPFYFGFQAASIVLSQRQPENALCHRGSLKTSSHKAQRLKLLSGCLPSIFRLILPLRLLPFCQPPLPLPLLNFMHQP